MRYSIIYLGLFYFLNMGYSVGQHSIDSLLSAAKKKVYDNPDEAIEIGKMILNDSLLDPNIRINGLFVVSLSYTTKRDYEKAIEYALQSKTLFDRIDPRWQIGSINQIGSLYQELKLYDKAISYLDESLKLIENLKPVDSIPKLLGYNYATRGLIYREQMSCDIAINFFDKAISEYKKTLDQPIMNANLSIIEYNKGNCLVELERLNQAEKTYTRALAYANKIQAKSLIAFALKGIAEVQTLQGDFNESILLLKEAYTYAEEIGDLELESLIYRSFANNYLALHEWEKFKSFNSKYETTIQALQRNERRTLNQSVSQTMVDYQKSLEKHELRNKKLIHYYLLSALFLVSILIVLVYIFEIKLRRLKDSVFSKQ